MSVLPKKKKKTQYINEFKTQILFVSKDPQLVLTTTLCQRIVNCYLNFLVRWPLPPRGESRYTHY